MQVLSRLSGAALTLFGAAALLSGLSAAPIAQPRLDVPYVPTPQEVVDRMLALGKVRAGEYHMDLGSGDGRIAVTAAAKFGARSFGVDLNPVRVNEARENAKKANVSHLATFEVRNLYRDRHQQGRHRDHVPVAVGQSRSTTARAQRHVARHPHRLARLRHGRLGAGREGKRHRPLGLSLDRAGARAGALDHRRPAQVHRRDPANLPEDHRLRRDRRQVRPYPRCLASRRRDRLLGRNRRAAVSLPGNRERRPH